MPKVSHATKATHTPSATTPEAGSGGRSKGLTPADYLTRILNAKVYDVAKETPLDVAERLKRASQQYRAAQTRRPTTRF